MDQGTIEKLADELAKHLPSYPVWGILLQVLLTITAAWMGAFLGEYFRTRGRNLATKADFDTLTQQLRTTTETVETIRSEVSQKDWAKREWINLRRVKLEALLEKMHDCDDYLEQVRTKAFEGEMLRERDPQPELTTIATLYFPELTTHVHNYSAPYRQQIQHRNVLVTALMAAGTDMTARLKAFAQHSAGFQEHYPELLTRADELRTAARALLVQIMGVEETSAN
jgi:hypothetical protein